MHIPVIRQKFFPLSIFLFFFLIYIASNGGHVDEYDGIYSFLITENFVLNNSLSLNVDSPSQNELAADISTYIKNAKYEMIKIKFYEQFPPYSKESFEYLQTQLDDVDVHNFYGPSYLVLPIIASPFYLLATIINFPVIHFVPLFVNSIIVAVSATMIFLLSKEIFNSEKVGFVLSLIFGLTSFMWPYITSMYSNPLGIMFLITALYFILKKVQNNLMYPLLGGICIGMSFLSHSLMLQMTPGFLIFGGFEFRKNKKKLLTFVVGFLIILIIQAYVNYARFGSVESFGFAGGNNLVDYSVGQLRTPANTFENMISGIYGYLFSPGRSIFLYFPAFLLAPIGLYYLSKKKLSLTILLVYWISIPFLYEATSLEWYFNPHWGTHRYLLAMIPPVTLSIGSILSEYWSTLRLKIGIILTSVTGFIVNLLGTIVWVMYAYSLGWSVEGVWKVQDKPAVFTWNPFFSGPVQALKVLSLDYVGTMQIDPDVYSYMHIGLHGCSFDNYIFCTFGIFPLIFLGIIIAIIGYFIIRKITKSEPYDSII